MARSHRRPAVPELALVWTALGAVGTDGPALREALIGRLVDDGAGAPCAVAAAVDDLLEAGLVLVAPTDGGLAISPFGEAVAARLAACAGLG